MDFIVTRWFRFFRTTQAPFSVISAARRAARSSSACLFAIATLCFASSSAAEEDVELIRFDIPAKTLAVALVDFAMQADIQVIGRGAPLSQVQSNRLQGRFTLEHGLGVLLTCSGFDGVVRNGAVHIRAAPLARSEGRCREPSADVSIATYANPRSWPRVSDRQRFLRTETMTVPYVQLGQTGLELNTRSGFACSAAGWRGAS